MKFLLCLFFMISVVFTACSNSEEPAVPTVPIDEVKRSAPKQLPEITFKNALDLEVGEKYRFRPSYLWKLYMKAVEPDEAVISSAKWGILGKDGKLVHRPDFPENPPGISIDIFFHGKEIYFYTPEGDQVVYYTSVNGRKLYDEIVVKITEQWGDIERGQAGERGNKIHIKGRSYKAIPIENLTNPDRVFERYRW